MKSLIGAALALRALGLAEEAPSWTDEFDGSDLNTSIWDSGSWLGGWNGEFHFYTGEPSNRSANVIVEDGKLYIQPDLTANYRPAGEQRLGWEPVLGCGRKHPSELK